MGKAIERPVPPDAMVGRFQVAIDKDAEPVDWDCMLARFLLAVAVRKPSASGLAPPEHKSAAIPLMAPSQYSGLNLPSDSCVVEGI